MFDTVTGLPVHALVVHAVVVLLPLAAVASALCALHPRLRRFLLWTVVADAVMWVVSEVAEQSGGHLQHRLSQPGAPTVAEQHGEYGEKLPQLALLLLLVTAVAWWVNRRRPGLALPLGVLVALVAVATIGWTVLVGDTGARAVWENVISASSGG